jgi:mono/diheme cytochrome c family protein
MLRCIFLVVPFLFVGCPGFGTKTLDDIQPTGELTYFGAVKEIVDTRCATCHAARPIAGAPNSLTTYQEVYDLRDRLVVRSVIEMTMPPGAALSDSERATLDGWVKAGAPEGVPGQATDGGARMDASLPESDGSQMQSDSGGAPMDYTWDEHIGPVMATSCSFDGCHGGGAPSAALDLSTYTGYIMGGAAGDLTGGGDAAQSLLIDHLLGRNSKLLMPLGSTGLEPEVIETFEAWVGAGSPEQ